MVQVGLVAYVEEQLEREISLRRLPRNGQLGSEQVLARIYNVSRGTVREALRRLAARGLVVQRPGRVARAVALDESLTLENLGMALHDERSEECRRLLEGFFCLKRQVLVELLADCCANASDADLNRLAEAGFRLWDAAKWKPGTWCAQLEFELLRLAAHAAARPGHLLLIQSLQRAMRGNAARLLSFMGGESLRQWAVCAMHALPDRDARAIQHQLPALLKACDEHVLDQFAPASQEPAAAEAHFAQDLLCAPTSAAGQDALEAHPCAEARGLGAPVAVIEQDDALEACPCAEARGIGAPDAATGRDDAFEARPCVGRHGLNASASAAEGIQALGVAPCPHVQALSDEPDGGALRSPAAVRRVSFPPGRECDGGDVTGAALGNVSDCRTGWDASSLDVGPQLEAAPADSGGQAHVAALKAGGSLHGTQGALRQWAGRLWGFLARFLRLPAS
ncbi:FadR/GntR family transcriptional regulator [Corallococcus sp. 4LFB]|uniref:FadR/GntR family transcriptional regulator n=1 Tax=Corallococcus sp. 4LFB TaxID=3383249 RepID=UPI00397679D9